MNDINLPKVVDLDSLTISLNTHLGLPNVNVNTAQFVPMVTNEDNRKRDTIKNLNLCGLYPNDDKCVAYTYGSDPIQVIDCHLPKGPYAPIVVLLIHGGFWCGKFNRSIEDAVGNDLLRFKIVVCNLDYRSIGNGGVYPTTFYDVANGTDLIRTIAQEHGFNSNRVIVVGHSAGGQLGGYITGRFRLMPNQPGYSTNPLRPIAFVSQAGLNNMWDACDQANETGSGAAISFLGGTYQMYPERYVLSSLAASSNLSVKAQYPSQYLPLEVPIQAITGAVDITVPISQTITFAEQARNAGDNCTRVIVEATGWYYKILASVDRYFASSRNALRRQWSSPKIAMRFIIVNIFFWCLIYIHIVVFYKNYPNNYLPQKKVLMARFLVFIC
ncbi:unnamed protein product [Rotaria sp. Silwood1]|nr:unnamed protein product [Rotaria sp. Silwood1]